jgi:chromatin remodeling complex protein RSC6|tara:strand:+ start:225 stop:833 length:609 start_codon:yes stop_codon:yes gene_type:complete
MPSNKKVSAPKKIVKKTPVVAKPVKDEVVDVPVQETSVVDAPVDVPVNTVDTYADEFTHLLEQLKSLQTTLKDLSVYTTKLERRVAKDQKAVQKRVNGKRKRVNTSSSPTGFSKPGPVSDELREFLKLEAGELVARTEVTKRINAYCKEHGLQGKEDKRILKPDKVLKTLLRLGKNDELTFFNLQKFMKVHFPNKEGVYPTL